MQCFNPDNKDIFSEYLQKLIKKKAMSEVQVYKKVHLDRRVLSKIRCDKSYIPSKHTLLTIAFSLELSIEEVEEFLKKGGYALYDCIMEDLVIRNFFENKIYDLFAVNDILNSYGFKTFGN